MNLSELENLIDRQTTIATLASSTLKRYRYVWLDLIRWLQDSKLTHFGEQEVNSYLVDKIGRSDYALVELTGGQHNKSDACRALINFLNTGEFRRRSFVQRVDFNAPEAGAEAAYYREFLLSLSEKLRPGTLTSYQKALSILFRYCNNHLLSLAELSAFHMVRLFDGSNLQHNTIYEHKLKLRAFLRWLHTKGYTPQDLSELLPKEKVVRDEKLPTTFTNHEVRAILNSIDRGTATGRRDYAILLCIAAYGWRISDICQLRLSHFNWRERTVSFIQVKTGVPLQAELAPEVFGAIVDYIKHGRPNAPEYDHLNQGELFLLLSKVKYGSPLGVSTVDAILYKYLRRAGITNLAQRKHSCHALRFSLATRMIEDGADIRIVKEVLGHQDTSVTFNYVRLDIAGLKRCNLPMQPCQSPFYSDLKEGS